MTHTYNPMGVCSMQITFDLDGGKIRNVKFFGGCSGNTQGISKLCEGRDAREVVSLLEGVSCAGKGTSCPDQLAKAIKKALGE